MTDDEPPPTQRDLRPDIESELDAAGFEDAEEIGRGGFGVVYRCAQAALDRTVAIKVLSADLDLENLERFLREEHAMGRLSGHPNIVDILQVDVTLTGRPFIVMPFHARGSLEAVVKREGPLSWQESLRVGIKIAGAVESAHRVGILHRDVKPANILLTAYGEPQLTDFGIARMSGGFETSTNMIAGSPAFTAPEVLRGLEPTAPSDVYGLGATLFCLVTGHAAFERRSGEKIVTQFLRITSETIPDLREHDIPADVADAIEAAMSADPAARPATAEAFGLLLREVQRAHDVPIDEMALPTDEDVARIPMHRDDTSRRLTGHMLPPTGVFVPDSELTSRPSPATKYRPDTPSRPLLERTRLIDVLRAGETRRLALIHAPAGFGKSTLARQWRDVLDSEGIAVAWLSVDRDDDSVVWFLAHLITAIRRARPDLAQTLGRIVEERGEDAERYVLTTLIDEVHASGTPVIVVIDDWHRITDVGVKAAVEFLLDSGCHHLRLVVTSRSRSGLPLTRLRVRDELVEIDSEALRLNAEETRAFLADLHGFTLTDSDAADLWASTEGWAAALQLVAMSLRNKTGGTAAGAGAQAAELLGRMSGRHHAIGEYLAENVLDTLETRMLEFLMSISVAERVSGSLAKALSDEDNAREMLEEADRRDLFIRRTDEDPQWFRFQPMFAEFLRSRLERDHPGRTRMQYLRASRWYAEHQMIREAVDNAVAAADLKLALDLIESSGMDLIENSRMSTLLGMVGKLPVQQVASRSKVMMAVARANVSLRRSKAARTALDKINHALDRDPEPEADAQTQRIGSDVLRAVDRLSTDSTEGVDELVAECLRRPDDVPAWMVSLAANVRSFVRLTEFDFGSVRSLQDWALKYHSHSADPLALVHGRCLAAVAARSQLDMPAAAELARNALDAAEQVGGGHSTGVRVASAILGQLSYDQDDLPAAERLLDESRMAGAELTFPDYMIAAFVTGARIEAAGGDLSAAERNLTAGAQLAEESALPRFGAAVAAEQLRWDLAVTRRTGSPKPAVNKGISVMQWEADEAAAIRSLLAEHRLGSDDEACARARVLASGISSRTRPLAALEAALLLTACLSAAGWMDEAKNSLAPAVAKCAEHGLMRMLTDAGSSVNSVVTALREDQRNGRWKTEWPAVPELFLAELG